MSVHGDGIRHGLSRVLVDIDFIAEHGSLVFFVHLVNGVAKTVANAVVALFAPNITDGELAQFVLTLIFVYSEDALFALRLADVHLWRGKIGLHHLRMVFVVVPHRVALLRRYFQRVGVFHNDVRQVYLRQGGELHAAVLVDTDRLGDVFQRRQLDGELACQAVGSDFDEMGVASFVACPCPAVDIDGVARPDAVCRCGRLMVLVQTVERPAVVVQFQCDGSHADVVLRRAEAHGQRVVALATGHAAHEVH